MKPKKAQKKPKVCHGAAAVLAASFADETYAYADADLRNLGACHMELRRQLIACRSLLTSASSHVFRQQHAGKHEQDKIDAHELLPRIEAFLRDCPLAPDDDEHEA